MSEPTEDTKRRILTDPEICLQFDRHFYKLNSGASGNIPRLPNYSIYVCRRCGQISLRATQNNEHIQIDFSITQPDAVEAIYRNAKSE